MYEKQTYFLNDFVSDLRLITAKERNDERIVSRVIPLAKKLAIEADWSDPCFRDCDEHQGFGIAILNEDIGNTLMVETICWLPGRGVAPHDHQTWGIVIGIEGQETNINWTRHDDGTRLGFADLTIEEELVIGPTDACSFMPNDIHSVRNTGKIPSLSLHVYGYSPGSRNRSEFDPLNKIIRPCPQRVRNRV